MPNALYNVTLKRCRRTSTICTSAAITRMKRIVRMYSKCNGTRRNLLQSDVTRPDSVMTKMTAPPMPSAVSRRFDTPKNGQMPKILLSTKLFTNTAPMIISKYSRTFTTPVLWLRLIYFIPFQYLKAFIQCFVTWKRQHSMTVMK